MISTTEPPTTTMTKQTSKQTIAELEARIARVRAKDRALETGQKIIFGSLLLNAARADPKMAKWVIEEAERVITRKIDQKRAAPILEELQATAVLKALGLPEVKGARLI
jgi:hypothetical protein